MHFSNEVLEYKRFPRMNKALKSDIKLKHGTPHGSVEMAIKQKNEDCWQWLSVVYVLFLRKKNH
eukprot:425336-Amphidinium_carterae.1